MVIGKGGETIRSLEADYEVQIDIEEDGTILVYATEGTKGDAAIAAITALTKDPEVGDEFTGKVVKTTDFGAFVELKKGTDGLLHVSNVGPGRVEPHRGRDRARRRRSTWSCRRSTRPAAGSASSSSQKHEDGKLVSPEELVERAKDAPPREPREERRAATTAAAAAAAAAARAATARARARASEATSGSGARGGASRPRRGAASAAPRRSGTRRRVLDAPPARSGETADRVSRLCRLDHAPPAVPSLTPTHPGEERTVTP